jgi:hypothetical protein
MFRKFVKTASPQVFQKIREPVWNYRPQKDDVKQVSYEVQQDGQCTYNLTLRHVRVTIVAVENQ